ncbi:hypothetical protein [Cohnella candidum]|uniref:Uncharacterized protein n=1 Tax=Cohnella candidum TaxID=2674991 RepID=A0A3G3K2S2_9BACL|nr:hypothetical protein [Cohnella candidum]AYQ74357.1 hypothetical protein EAV92_18360 [Cohnella candidum]
MLQLSGIVGGNAPIRLGPKQRRDLQTIVIDVPNGKKLILKRLNFLLSNDAFVFIVEALPGTGVFRAKGGSGDLRPNKVLFNNKTGDTVRIFLNIAVLNSAKNTRNLDPQSTWLLKLARCSIK